MLQFLQRMVLNRSYKNHAYLIGIFFAVFTNVVTAASGDSTMTNITFQLDGEKVEIFLDENDAARDLLSLLPQQLEWDDYGGVEKISYLPRKISIQGTPDGYTPIRGDFAYYAPWGNIVIFCKPFSYSPGLIKLGHVNTGLEAACRKGKYTVVMKTATTR